MVADAFRTRDIDYVVLVSCFLTSAMISTTCVMSICSNDIRCEYMFLFPVRNLARIGLRKHGDNDS